MGILTKYSDDQGAAILGWLGPNVLYARFEGIITDSLGSKVARRLTALVGDQAAVQFFCDNSRITSFDVKAFGAVVDALLAQRDQFELIVAHTGDFPLSARAKALPEAFARFELVASDSEFELRLSSAARMPNLRDVTALVDREDGPFEDTSHLADSSLAAPAATELAGDRSSDFQGTVFLGWLGDGVLYSRFERTITARLAARFAHRFSALVASSVGASYFSDSSGVVHYEPRAFGFISDALLSNRARFARVIVRPRTDSVATWKGTFPEALPGLERIPSEAEFVARLRAARAAASSSSVRAPDALPYSNPLAGALTYAFDLTHFEEGRLTAVRHALPPAPLQARWTCVAHSDRHALEQARVAALVEWAKPRTRPPEQFTVRFTDTPGDPTFEQRS